MYFSDPVMLLNCVKKAASKGAKIELNDDPRNRRLGYKAGNETWIITLTDLKRASKNPAKKDLVELFKTPEGRLKALNEG